jgi:hypothetical protein
MILWRANVTNSTMNINYYYYAIILLWPQMAGIGFGAGNRTSQILLYAKYQIRHIYTALHSSP